MAVLNIPITKAGNKTLAVDTDIDLADEHMYRMALEEGLKVMLNKKMSKIASLKGLSESEKIASIEAAMSKAEANLADVRSGKMKKGRAAASDDAKIDAKTKTEAMRMARELVKDALKANKVKISHVKASEITAAAKEVLEADPSIYDKAKANLEARANIKPTLNIAALVHIDPKLVAKDEADKATKAAAKANAPLSAKQAGKVAPRKQAQTN